MCAASGELNTTHRELRLMAAAAIIGFNVMPKAGYRAPAARGTADRIIENAQNKF